MSGPIDPRVKLPSGWESVVHEDIFGDSAKEKIYLDKRKDGTSNIWVGYNYLGGDGRFALHRLKNFGPDEKVTDIGIGDYDGDGYVDIYYTVAINGEERKTWVSNSALLKTIFDDTKKARRSLLPEGTCLDGASYRAKKKIPDKGGNQS